MFKSLIQEENLIRRRAGLYGLSVITVSLYQKVRLLRLTSPKKSQRYSSQLLRPVINCFKDKDVKV